MPQTRVIVTADQDGQISGVAFTSDDAPATDFCLEGHKVTLDKRIELDEEAYMALDGYTFICEG